MSLWLEGMVMGFSIAAPGGEVGFLCIQQTLQGGLRLGMATGLGAAVADMMYGIMVALGLGAMQSFFLRHQVPISFIGGLFLCYLGIKKFFEEPPHEIRGIGSAYLLKAFLSTFLFTLADPETILDFMALFTGLTIDVSEHLNSIKFVVGVFIGSALWWLFLSVSVGFFGRKISHQLLGFINYAAGAVIIGFGLVGLYHVLI